MLILLFAFCIVVAIYSIYIDFGSMFMLSSMAAVFVAPFILMTYLLPFNMEQMINDTPYTEYDNYLGTVTMIDSTTAVTAAHMVRPKVESIPVIFDDVAIKAKVVHVDTYTDVAVLKFDGDVTLAIKRPITFPSVNCSITKKFGDQLTAIGYPSGMGPVPMNGKMINQSAKMLSLPFVARLTEIYDGTVLTSVPVLPGMSGGPVIDSAGNLVGITSKTLVDPATQGNLLISVVVKTSTVCDAIAKSKEAK